MTTAESWLRAQLQAQFPDVLTIAQQYAPMYGMTFFTAVRYALGLVGNAISDADYARALSLIERAESGNIGTPATGGTSAPVAPLLLVAAAVAALSLVK